jgi:N-acetylmuramoyl-L-alanine amidase
VRRIRKVIVHHTAGPDITTVEGIRRYHTLPPPPGRGWCDIGYHHLVHRVLFVSEPPRWVRSTGRPESRAGAHDEGQNADSIGVCIAGDYTRGPVPADGWAVLVATVADVCRRYGLTADAVEGHGEHEPRGSATACPGFDPALLRVAVAEQLRRVA